jgi:predicted dehydrogenase
MQAAERGKVGAQVAFNRRYMPIMQRALEILRTAFGTPFSGRIIYEMLRLDRWDADFSTTAIHAVDAALFLAGSPFRAADLRFQTQTRAGLEAVDISFEAECASGSRVLINIQPVSGRNAESVRIEAVDQSLTVSVPFLPQGNAEGRLEHWRGDRMVASCSDSDCDSVERLGVFGETKGFLDALRFAGAFVPALEDCRQQVVLMEAFRLRRSGAFGFDAS